MVNPPNNGLNFKVTAIFLVIVGFLLIVCLAAGGTLLAMTFLRAESNPPPVTPAAGMDVTATLTLPRAAAPSTVTAIPYTVFTETTTLLRQTVIPQIDSGDVAARLQGKKNVSDATQEIPPQYKVGDKLDFWALNDDTSVHFKVHTSLAFISEHLYFWVQDNVRVDSQRLQALGQAFENQIYPTDRAFFGSEWTPGVDNDPHLYVVYTLGLSSHTGGYFSSEDEINPLIDPYSNGHEMFVINAVSFPVLDDRFYGVLAHEFQHMISYNQHRNQVGWMNEGFSVLATFINGYGSDGYDALYTPDPDLQLNDFPNDQNQIALHYGAAFLFLDYFLNRFGEQATQTLTKVPQDGLDGVDTVLNQIGAKDASTGKPITADDVFADWSVANYLLDPSVGDGRYAYSNYPAARKTGDTESVARCPTSDQSRTVHQYGVDYIHIYCRGSFTLSFQGNQDVSLLPTDPHSGSYYFWSNEGDESDMTLTRSFDLSAVSGPVTLSYWTWFDIEKNYDYVYLEASTDGQDWSILKTPSGTADNPGNNNLGYGYNGASNRWINETVDLSKYAGQKVQIRFEYQTDSEVYGEGFLLDDISIPQIAYQTDLEKDDGGWQAAGFVRVQNHLPQTYRLELIELGSPRPSVRYLELNADQSLSIPLVLTNDVVLVISGSTRYTRAEASYTFSIK